MALQQAGFSVVTAHVPDIKRGRQDFVALIERYDPTVILYDIAPPYEENWTFLRLLQDLEPVRGRAWVLTTTNKRMLESLVGPTDAHEIVGKPYDIEQVTAAVRRAAERATR